MRLALITRPQWDPPLASFIDHDSRLIGAPLQQLRLLAGDQDVFSEWQTAPSRWLVLTSPASVVALQRWCANHQGSSTLQGDFGVAAVGGGTRDQAARLLKIDAQEIIVSGADETADAVSLVAALKAFGDSKKSNGFEWRQQSFLVIEGEGNRPTLRDGLSSLGAHVLAMALYARIDVDWPAEFWAMIDESNGQTTAQAQGGRVGIVITSSAMVLRVTTEFARRGIGLDRVIWCTQHATIARHLSAQGVGRVRRVRLDEGVLQHDLFDDEQYW